MSIFVFNSFLLCSVVQTHLLIPLDTRSKESARLPLSGAGKRATVRLTPLDRKFIYRQKKIFGKVRLVISNRMGIQKQSKPAFLKETERVLVPTAAASVKKGQKMDCSQ